MQVINEFLLIVLFCIFGVIVIELAEFMEHEMLKGNSNAMQVRLSEGHDDNANALSAPTH